MPHSLNTATELWTSRLANKNTSTVSTVTQLTQSISSCMLTSLVIRPVEGKYFAATYIPPTYKLKKEHPYLYIYLIPNQTDGR